MDRNSQSLTSLSLVNFAVQFESCGKEALAHPIIVVTKRTDAQSSSLLVPMAGLRNSQDRLTLTDCIYHQGHTSIVGPPIKGTLNKGHSTNIFHIKDLFSLPKRG